MIYAYIALICIVVPVTVMAWSIGLKIDDTGIYVSLSIATGMLIVCMIDMARVVVGREVKRVSDGR